MSQYLWEKPNWTEFSWNHQAIWPKIAAVKFKQGQLITKLSSLGIRDQTEALASTLALETQQTAKIEGESFALEQVRSSINRRFGLSEAGLPAQNRSIDGLVDVLLDATLKANQDLTKNRICFWHKALFPTGISGLRQIHPGKYRDDLTGDMEIVSGAFGHEQIHYLAPPAKQLNQLMNQFYLWWQKSELGSECIIKSGVAHAYFVLIHPFEDGNGRIARALTDMALAQGDGMKYRYYSMSAQLMQRRREYYQELEKIGKGTGDLTDWLSWFISQFELAIDSACQRMDNVFLKTTFWNQHSEATLSSRQRKAVNLVLEAEPDGFIGGMSTGKYVAINKTSRATAYRELSDLVTKGIFETRGIGRGLRYQLKKTTKVID